MRILVTGVTGQVGAALSERLPEFGDIVAADRTLFDLAQPEHIPARLDALAPDMIVNPAAFTAVDRAESERELAFAVNAEAPRVMAAWAARRGVPMLHFSTEYVFDGSGTAPWREDDAPHPLSVYGASKLAGDQAVMTSGTPHLIVRTSWVYAATGRNFMRRMAELAGERAELRVVADQVGAPTSAAVIAEMLAHVFRRHGTDFAGAFERVGGLVNLTASGTTSWHGFAEAIVRGLTARGRRLATQRVVAITSRDYPTPAARPVNSRLDLSRVTALAGVAPPSWKVALDRELDLLVAGT